MSYLALYRKYRPVTFDRVIGQNHITTALQNQIKNGQVSHAYLFCGTRGTGKTSVAKIFARAINCESAVNGSPCGKCKTCQELSNANNMDILEIDAASNNRVDEIRELREKVKYPPVNGKYKVYIVDEVHMLTDSAFNALLKTLEEPPAHVVFILATTEVNKLPATILSRLIRFDFKLVGNNDLEELVKYIFTEEKIKFEQEAISEIARLGEGSVRDTLSVADMCVAYSNRNVTYASVLESVGAIDKTALSELAAAIVSGNAKGLLSKLDTIINAGKNINQIAKDLSNFFRDLAVVKTCTNYADILKYPADVLKELNKTAAGSDIQKILNALKAFSSLENEFRYTNNPRIVLEICALNLCAEEAPKKTMELSSAASPQITEHITPVITKELSGFDDYKADILTVWGKMMVALRESEQMILQAVLSNVKAKEIVGGELRIYSPDDNSFKALTKPENIAVLNSCLSSCGVPYVISVVKAEPAEKKEDIKAKLIQLFPNIEFN